MASKVEKGKVVILGGTPRAGKTTLAVRLAHNGFSKLSWDSLSDAIRNSFPEVSINDWTCQELCAQRLYSFFESIVENAVNDARVSGLNTVIDMYDFSPEYVHRLPNQNELDVYFLAYPGLTIKEIRHNISFFAEPTDWIAQVSESYLDTVAERCFFFNEKLVRQCKEFGYELINTGAGCERTQALDDLYERIIERDSGMWK